MTDPRRLRTAFLAAHALTHPDYRAVLGVLPRMVVCTPEDPPPDIRARLDEPSTLVCVFDDPQLALVRVRPVDVDWPVPEITGFGDLVRLSRVSEVVRIDGAAFEVELVDDGVLPRL